MEWVGHAGADTRALNPRQQKWSQKLHFAAKSGLVIGPITKREIHMTWTYSQSTGRLKHNGLPQADGYSGWGAGKNNVSMQATSSIGPIPKGEYRIAEPFTHPHAGPYTMRLHPKPGTMTYGRSGFMIHGDSVSNPGSASEGCIILAPTIRHRIWNSGDRNLEVVQ